MMARRSDASGSVEKSMLPTDHALAEALARLRLQHRALQTLASDEELQTVAVVGRQSTWASTKQRRILASLVERYVHDDALAAALIGQQKFWL